MISTTPRIRPVLSSISVLRAGLHLMATLTLLFSKEEMLFAVLCIDSKLLMVEINKYWHVAITRSNQPMVLIGSNRHIPFVIKHTRHSYERRRVGNRRLAKDIGFLWAYFVILRWNGVTFYEQIWKLSNRNPRSPDGCNVHSRTVHTDFFSWLQIFNSSVFICYIPAILH